MKNDEIAIFALNASRDFGERICAHLRTSLTAHEEREFEDGEHKSRPLASVRGKDGFVIQSLYSDAQQSVNDKLCRLLFFLGALRDASAGRITAVIPYLCYARKDRKSKPRDPVTTRYVASMFQVVGTDHVVTLDVHNLSAFQNAWRITTDHLEARKLFVQHFIPMMRGEDVVVVSPDVGGVKRAEDFRQAFSKKLGREVSAAFVEKYRSAGIVSGQALIGDVAGKAAIIIDDLISSGTTLARAAEACRVRGATSVYAAASHAVFTAKAHDLLSNAAFDQIAVTNSVSQWRLDSAMTSAKLAIIDITQLFATAIERIHTGESIVEILEP